MNPRIPYETRDFIKGLESQDKIRNRSLTTNKEGETPPSFGFSKVNIQLIFQLWKRLSLKNKAEAEHVQEQDAHARTLSSLMPSMHRQRCTKSLKRYKAQNPSLYASVSLKPLSSHERFFNQMCIRISRFFPQIVINKNLNLKSAPRIRQYSVFCPSNTFQNSRF